MKRGDGGIIHVVDHEFDDPGARDPIPNTPNERRNPLVGLPDIELVADAIVVTHTHADHFDDAAAEALSSECPVFCQPPDVEEISEAGFDDVRSVGGAT